MPPNRKHPNKEKPVPKAQSPEDLEDNLPVVNAQQCKTFDPSGGDVVISDSSDYVDDDKDDDA